MRLPFPCACLAAGVAVFAVARPARTQDADAQFQRIKSHMAEHSARLPNYTCHETVERTQRVGSQFRYLDTLQLEVAFTGAQEIFSRPGSDHFGSETVERIAGGGTIGNSALGSHTDSLVFQDGVVFKSRGKCKKDGRHCLRYDFRVPLEQSHFHVRRLGNEGVAGYHGSIWFDEETFDPVRVDLDVDRIPSYIGVRRILESLHYKNLAIGKSQFDLPDHSELSATDELGNDTLNLTRLSQCREFSSDSVIKYAAPAATRDGHRQ